MVLHTSPLSFNPLVPPSKEIPTSCSSDGLCIKSFILYNMEFERTPTSFPYLVHLSLAQQNCEIIIDDEHFDSPGAKSRLAQWVLPHLVETLNVLLGNDDPQISLVNSKGQPHISFLRSSYWTEVKTPDSVLNFLLDAQNPGKRYQTNESLVEKINTRKREMGSDKQIYFFVLTNRINAAKWAKTRDEVQPEKVETERDYIGVDIINTEDISSMPGAYSLVEREAQNFAGFIGVKAANRYIPKKDKKTILSYSEMEEAQNEVAGHARSTSSRQ
ncbi:hypothetical protein C8Q75DRAFT_224661 [Abortiporus biennis]|nr:hypothetical protein C8Q75DRAFT_224661 [Abortiporus biennis]